MYARPQNACPFYSSIFNKQLYLISFRPLPSVERKKKREKRRTAIFISVNDVYVTFLVDIFRAGELGAEGKRYPSGGTALGGWNGGWEGKRIYMYGQLNMGPQMA